MTFASILLADVYLSWLPAGSTAGVVCLLVVCLFIWGILRIFWGPSKASKRAGIVALRFATFSILAVILLGPTIVDEQGGEVVPPQIVYLFDGSQSMMLGQDRTRWEESLQFVADAQSAAGEQHCENTQAFRFGHRLAPLSQTAHVGRDNEIAKSNGPGVDGVSLNPVSWKGVFDQEIESPDATDSRLADALRQLLPLVNSDESAGVVLLSDGRVRASESVENLAELFRKSGVPLHVVPVGKVSGNGDVAIVSLVVPSRVRKYTENELQVFFRSYGFTGQRTTIRVIRQNKADDSEALTMATLPITLNDGAQSASLTFRVNEKPEDLLITIDPLGGELTDRNNQIDTQVQIDRTKIRVLYLDRERPGLLQQDLFGSNDPSLPMSNTQTMKEALEADLDIECRVLYCDGVNPPAPLPDESLSSRPVGFPETRAELFAYDCIVFNDLAPNVLTKEQSRWIAQWIQGRGGGLILSGGQCFDWQRWDESELLPLLPIHLSSSPPSVAISSDVEISMPQHAVWQMRLEHNLNKRLLDQLPPLSIGSSDFRVKSTADILAKRTSDNTPVMTAHRVGRGRVLVSTAALGGNAFQDLVLRWGLQSDRVAAKLWRNLVYWATEGSLTGRRRLVAEADKLFYRPGETVSIKATTYDESAERVDRYQVWAMFEPVSLEDDSLYSPLLWPNEVVRDSGEVSPRIAWGEEIPLRKGLEDQDFDIELALSEAKRVGDNGLRVELTAYEGGAFAYGHGTQVDSCSLDIKVLSDPFEQRNPMPNHELLRRVASVTGGEVIQSPRRLASLLERREMTIGPARYDFTPAWSRWWLWLLLIGLLTTEWVWRRFVGLA